MRYRTLRLVFGVRCRTGGFQLIIVSSSWYLSSPSEQEIKMRALVCCAVLLLVCTFAQVQGGCQYKEEILTTGQHHRDCLTINCKEDDSMIAVPCPEVHCRNQIGYQDTDLSKPFPECCARPICKN